MTPQQIDLVQRSFAAVLPIRAEAAALFYGRLFALDPALRPLFKGDLKAQGVKLMAVLATVVGALGALEPLLGQVDALAQRHVAYGVQEANYATVGEALIWTLEQGLGAEFSEPTREAWLEAYAVLSGRMIEAARTAPAKAA